MLNPGYQALYNKARCLPASSRPRILSTSHFISRHSSSSPPHRKSPHTEDKNEGTLSSDRQIRYLSAKEDAREEETLGSTNASDAGAMSRRLAEATEEALLEGGRAGRNAVSEAGFSEELKTKLLVRIESATFKSENAAAFAQASLSENVGKGSRAIAAGQAWDGSEETADSVLRMLDDARKPLAPKLRGKRKIPLPMVDMSLNREPRQKPGQRLANARDKMSVYTSIKDSQMSPKDWAALKQEFKDRFTPGARAMPNSIRGLAALANERIEDAIARGQFKNIPRGKAIERDARADNPFLDTTEYIMNKIIQRQEIVPPWIEKQQELSKAASTFRSRLRNDWRRQAARSIASRGGSLQEQMRTANRYAEAERVYNPMKRAVEDIAVSTNATDDPAMAKMREAALSEGEHCPVQGTVEADRTATMPGPNHSSMQNTDSSSSAHTTAALPPPFRLPSWIQTESSYLNLSITNLNSITRSYNLMAPDLVKKPYFSLERELMSCYADVAPTLAETIKERASRPAKTGNASGKGAETIIDWLHGGAAGQKATVFHKAQRPAYGLREWWSDVRPWGRRSKHL